MRIVQTVTGGTQLPHDKFPPDAPPVISSSFIHLFVYLFYILSYYLIFFVYSFIFLVNFFLIFVYLQNLAVSCCALNSKDRPSFEKLSSDISMYI